MSNIINLNKARKAREHRDKEKRAEENRVKFGRTKSEKAADVAQLNKDQQHLDGHKKDTPPEKDPA